VDVVYDDKRRVIASAGRRRSVRLLYFTAGIDGPLTL
jgi:hypothetical protein